LSGKVIFSENDLAYHLHNNQFAAEVAEEKTKNISLRSLRSRR